MASDGLGLFLSHFYWNMTERNLVMTPNESYHTMDDVLQLCTTQSLDRALVCMRPLGIDYKYCYNVSFVGGNLIFNMQHFCTAVGRDQRINWTNRNCYHFIQLRAFSHSLLYCQSSENDGNMYNCERTTNLKLTSITVYSDIL